MTTKRSADGWRAFSRTKEDPYKTAETVSASYHNEAGPAQVKVQDKITNESEQTGRRDATTLDIITKMLTATHQQRAFPDLCALAFASCLQKVTTDQPAVGTDPNTYRHYIERLLTSAGVELSAAAITMIEDDGVQQKEYAGCIFKSVELSTARGGFAQLVGEIVGSGNESNDSTSQPSAPSESYLLAGDLTINLGSGLTGTVAGGDLALSGGSDISAKVRDFSYKVDNGAVPIYEIGDQTKEVTRFEQGARFAHELKMKIEMEATTYHDALLAETEYALYLPLVGSTIETNYNYTVALWFPQVQIMEVNKTVEDGIVVLDTDWMVQDDATLGSVIVEVLNQTSAYLG